MSSILPLAETQFCDALGVPLAGGTVAFYAPGTTTPKDTWSDFAQTILNSNPILLDSAGRALIVGSGSYRQVVKDANGNLIWDQTTAEPVTGAPSFGGTSTGTANAQIVSAGTFTGADGSQINFIAGFTNTGAMTLQVGASGSPIPLLKNTPSGPGNLAAGDVTAGNAYSVAYSVSLGIFQLLQSLPAAIVIASQADAQAGTNNTNVMTPLRTNQAIQALGTPLTATGDMLYADTPTTKARLGIGTAGQVLQVNTGATAPQWTTLAQNGTVQTASGTAVNFSIPAGVREVTIMARGISFTAAGALKFRIGPAGGLATTGYEGGFGLFQGASNTIIVTDSMYCGGTGSAAGTVMCFGKIVLMDASKNVWGWYATGYAPGSNAYVLSSAIALSGQLSQISFFEQSGGTFDAGTLNIAWSL